MTNLISCRPESYGRYADRAFEALQQLGVRWVEIPAPAPDKIDEAREKMHRFGLDAASVTLGAKGQQPDFLDRVRDAVNAAAALGAKVIFTSQHTDESGKQPLFARLKQAGEIAAGKDIVIALETHPDLCNNATVALETMNGIDHPNVRINFDPANIHYYNQDVDAVNELRQIAPYVRAVHLKDTNGGFHAHHFPAIGDGVVDWKGIFSIVNARGMTGPFTLEMEGIAGEDLSFEQTQARIQRSLDFLRSLGVME